MLDCVACKKKEQSLYYFICFYIILYDFIKCPAFIGFYTNFALKVAIEQI